MRKKIFIIFLPLPVSAEYVFHKRFCLNFFSVLDNFPKLSSKSNSSYLVFSIKKSIYSIIILFQNQRIESLGPPSEPWAISVSLEGTSDSMLKGRYL